MPKPRKKPSVAPKLGRDWLRRSDEDGESPPQIAENDGYDVRTVRKAIDRARQEREMREARTLVYRKAVEDHYGDLVLLAQKLDEEISKEPVIPVGFKDDRIMASLKQHMPRSPLWKAMDSLEKLNADIDTIDKSLGEAIRSQLQQGDISRLAVEKGMLELNIEGLTGAVVHSLKIPADQVPLIKPKAVQLKKGVVEISYGPWNCGTARDEQAGDAEKFISEAIIETGKLPGAADLREQVNVRRKVISDVREALATITLRRILPGRCKYCPM